MAIFHSRMLWIKSNVSLLAITQPSSEFDYIIELNELNARNTYFDQYHWIWSSLSFKNRETVFFDYGLMWWFWICRKGKPFKHLFYRSLTLFDLTWLFQLLSYHNKISFVFIQFVLSFTIIILINRFENRKTTTTTIIH